MAATSDPLVSADWLRQHIGEDSVFVLDATSIPVFDASGKTGAEAYTEAHIPGAVYFDINAVADQKTEMAHMMLSADDFSSMVSALGVRSDHHIIAYDSHKFFASARVWWMFRTMGHDHVHVLDGGLNAWKQAGGETSEIAPVIEPGDFHANIQPDLIRDMSQMRGHVDAADRTILDARAQGRFDGTSPEPRAGMPSGHMPGSSCVSYGSLLNADGTLKSSEDLAPLLSRYLDDPIATSCGSGITAAVISLALARLGKWDVALYDGSWSEWASHADNPIATVT